MILFLILSVSQNIGITPDSSTVGDPIILTIRGYNFDSLQVIMPDSFPDIALLDTFEIEGDSIARLQFTSFSTGIQDIKLKMGNDTVSVAYFVESVLKPENKGLSPIREPYGFFNWYYLLWLLLIPSGIAGFYFFRRFRKEKTFIEHPEMEPSEEALKNLEILEGKIGKWNWNQIYTSLSYIIRRYIERRAGIPAVETTTSELVRIIRGNNHKILIPVISRFPRWDLIKFADEDSNQEEIAKDIELIKSVIGKMEEEEENDSLP